MSIALFPDSSASAKVVLAFAMEEVKEGDVVFVVRLSGEDAHITSTSFQTHDICWASQILNAHAVVQAST